MSPQTERVQSSKPTTSIDDLPPEMICELFEHLPLKDLAACSLVNKRWHSIYSNFKVHSLVVTNYHRANPRRNVRHGRFDLDKWYKSNQTIREAERCPPTMFLRLAEKPLLSNLRHLAVCMYKPEFDLNELNRFQQLLHLEINVSSIDEAMHLNLSRLKVLAFHRYNKNCPLSIDCPLLSTLLYHGEPEDANLLDVKHPETIRMLETNMFSPEWLIPFKSVECLVTDQFKVISQATLLSLPRLRELRYEVAIDWVFMNESHRGVSTLDRVKRTLSEFLSETRKLRGSDFRFTFAGLQLNNVNVDQIDFGAHFDERFREDRVHNEYVYMKNYHLIEPGALHFVNQIDYTRLLNHVTGEFPRCFLLKFTDIGQVLTTAKVQDPDHFLRFLKSLRSLRSLWLDGTRLGQAFYDQLPASAHSLDNLYLCGEHCENGLQLNFDFIGSFSYLSELVINRALSLESLPSLVRSLGKLEEAEFGVRVKEKVFKINKLIGSAEWWITRGEKAPFRTENPDEIANFFEELQG